MMPKATPTKFGHLTDKELVVLIKEEQEYLGEVYKRCKSYSIQFMRKMTSGNISEYELEDVFQDSILVLYEKIVAGNFELTASFQTYLNSVCRFQLLTKMKKDNLTSEYDDYQDENEDENPMSFRSSITDCLDEIEDPKEAQLNAIEKALRKMKGAGSHCYELLTLFWYHQKSMNEIADKMNYTNGANAKHQKSRCQEKLRKLTFIEMNNI